MQSKTNVVPILKSIVSYAHTQFNTKVKTIRTDNALELCEGYAKEYYTQNGIEHQTSIRDTPQQNGVVERKHRHLLETARALCFQANLPMKFWGECVLTATYMINRFPLSSLKNKTPFETFHKKKPEYHHLRSFGCLCFVSTLKKDRNKFSPRAKPCVFMGYPYGQKGYKVLDIESGELFTSRDITFHETVFPFHKQNNTPKASVFPDFTDYDTPEHSSTHTLNTPNTTTPEPTAHTEHLSTSPNQFTFTPQETNDVATSHPNLVPENVLRRSSRPHKVPTYLQDYETTTTNNHWCNIVQYSKFPSSFHAFVSCLAAHHEPMYYHEADAHPQWTAAMQHELTALINNDTWDLVDLPKGKKAIGSRWVYKLKYKNDGTIDRHKARLVARGFSRIPGIDFDEKFSPVVKMTTIRCLIAIAAARRWDLHQLDVNNMATYMRKFT